MLQFSSHRLHLIAVMLMATVILAGCASRAVGPDLSASHFLHDKAFAGSEKVRVESSQDVFRLDKDIRQHLSREVSVLGNTKHYGQALAHAILRSMADFNYDGTDTTTASQTFHNRKANCLSMTILAYAMAKYVGFDTTFRYVDIPEYWLWRKQRSLVSRHVNVVLDPADTGAPISGAESRQLMEIDFFAPGSSKIYGSHKISKSTILAMFYNNKGASALLAGNKTAAYAYFRAAVLEDPKLDMAISNLAILYGSVGRLNWAAANLREVLDRNPMNGAAAEGLASILRGQGHNDEAAQIIGRFKHRWKSNPFYQFMLGQKAYASGRWHDAIRGFNKALELRPNLDLAYFGLAKAYFQLGDLGRTKAYLSRAKYYATREVAKKRYQSKLALLGR